VRKPSRQELRGTSVMRIELNEASAKVRSGPPVDEDADYELPVWAGTVGLRLVAGEPEPDRRLRPGVARPNYVDEL
jgi:hypothetical protein